MSKKQIGIPGWVGSGMFGITQPYAEYISKFGNLVILSPNDTFRKDIDLLILPGGADVSPARYSDEASFYSGNNNPLLEFFDSNVLPDYLQNGTPIIGICRGAQSLWTIFGGKMVQHNPYHEQSDFPKDECHRLEWSSKENEQMYGKLIKKVNSRHHQTMNSYQAPPELEVLAFSKEGDKGYVDKSIVEIFKHRKLPIFGLQSHPEDMPNDNLTPNIIFEFLHTDNG